MVVTMRGKPAMHHSKVDLGQPLSHRPRQRLFGHPADLLHPDEKR
jgi:hypothetical protein